MCRGLFRIFSTDFQQLSSTISSNCVRFSHFCGWKPFRIHRDQFPHLVWFNYIIGRMSGMACIPFIQRTFECIMHKENGILRSNRNISRFVQPFGIPTLDNINFNVQCMYFNFSTLYCSQIPYPFPNRYTQPVYFEILAHIPREVSYE